MPPILPTPGAGPPPEHQRWRSGRAAALRAGERIRDLLEWENPVDHRLEVTLVLPTRSSATTAYSAKAPILWWSTDYVCGGRPWEIEPYAEWLRQRVLSTVGRLDADIEENVSFPGRFVEAAFATVMTGSGRRMPPWPTRRRSIRRWAGGRHGKSCSTPSGSGSPVASAVTGCKRCKPYWPGEDRT